MTTADEVKELLSEPKLRIKLYDYIQGKTSQAISRATTEEFSINVAWSSEKLAARLSSYEELSGELISAMALLGFWGSSEHLISASIPPRQFSPQLDVNLSNRWTALRWYPLILMMYALGLGATAANNYHSLHIFFETRMNDSSVDRGMMPLILAIDSGLRSTRDSFKLLPGHEKQFTPLSEYLFELLPAKLNNVLSFSNDYEAVYDRFEILFALQQTHESKKISRSHILGPIGRFGWKYAGGSDSSPFQQFHREALDAKSSWLPLKSGFFNGSFERFEEVVKEYEGLLQGLHWH